MEATFSKILYSFGAAASIAGLLVILFAGSGVERVIALIVFILFLTFLLWKVVSTFNLMVKQRYPKGYLSISTFANFTTVDGLRYTYEVFKHIQSKQLFMNEYRYGFHWTGTGDPEITSDLQEAGKVIQTEEGTYNRVILRLKESLLYDQTEVIHIHMELDDSDRAASPHLDFKVIDPIKMINWNVELRHKAENPEAEVCRRKVEAEVPQEFEHLTSIAFDTVSRSYRHHKLNPEVGYYYRLRWER